MNNKDENTDGLIFLYQEYSETIRETKRASWRGVYYVLLVLAGLIGFKYIEAVQNSHPINILIIISYCGITLFVIWYIWNCQFCIERYRRQTDRIRNKIGGEFKEIVYPIKDKRDRIFPIVFSIVIWISNYYLFISIYPKEYIWQAIVMISIFVLGIFLIINVNSTQRNIDND